VLLPAPRHGCILEENRRLVSGGIAGSVFSLKALRMAIKQACGDDLTGLIHHSDRGVQYCCDLYVEELQKYGIRISMTEDYKPTDNGIAERVNGIIKGESLYRQKRRFPSYEKALEQIKRFILFYNGQRPHYSIGMQTPDIAHKQAGEQKKMWKNKIYQKKSMSLLINRYLCNRKNMRLSTFSGILSTISGNCQLVQENK